MRISIHIHLRPLMDLGIIWYFFMVPPNWTAVSGLFIQGHYFQYPEPDLIWPNPNLQIRICRYFQYLDVYGKMKINRYILYILIPSHPILQRQSPAFFHPWTLQSPARWPRANCWPNAPSLAQRGIFHRGRDLKPRYWWDHGDWNYTLHIIIHHYST